MLKLDVLVLPKTVPNVVGVAAAPPPGVAHCVPVPVEASTCPEVPTPPPAVSVPVSVGLDNVSPATVVTVAPEAIDVEPRVGAVYEEIPVKPAPDPVNDVAAIVPVSEIPPALSGAIKVFIVPSMVKPFLTLKFLSDISFSCHFRLLWLPIISENVERSSQVQDHYIILYVFFREY